MTGQKDSGVFALSVNNNAAVMLSHNAQEANATSATFAAWGPPAAQAPTATAMLASKCERVVSLPIGFTATATDTHSAKPKTMTMSRSSRAFGSMVPADESHGGQDRFAQPGRSRRKAM